MAENQVEGTVQNVAGKVQDAVGGLTGDAVTQFKGKARQVAGQVQQNYGNAMDCVRTFATDNPFCVIAAAATAGFVIGALWASRD